MSIKNPFAILKERYILLDQNDTLSLQMHNMNNNYFFVLDIYPVENPSHPTRHPGWFKFGSSEKSDLSFRIKYTNGKIQIQSIDDLKIEDSWVSEYDYKTDIFPLNIRIVIRKKINNEISFENNIICYYDDKGYINDKKYFNAPQSLITDILPTQLILPMKMNVCIISKNFYDNDAIGYFIWEMYSLLKTQGINALIYATNCDDKFRSFTRHITELLIDKELSVNDTLLIYNYSIKDDYLDSILDLPYKKIVYFHGITKPDALKIFDAELAEECKAGLSELYKINKADSIIVNSSHTKKNYIDILKKHVKDSNDDKSKVAKSNIEYDDLKIFNEIKVIPPILISQKIWDELPSDNQFEKSLSAMGDVVLFVGRMFPHKKIEELLDVFHELLQINPNAILALVGGMHNSYQKYLKYKIDNLNQSEKERILFLQQVSRNQLKASYKAAKVFITLSEDEGFCVPILEAMRFHLPIIAKKAPFSAADELLGNAGKLVVKNEPYSIAVEINRLIDNNKYREKIVTYQDNILKKLSDEHLSTDFVNTLLGVYYNNENID